MPALEATIRRRLLLNLRVDPTVAAALLPDGLTPQLVDGAAVVGVCVVRLEALRPPGFPARLGVSSESAAHRIAVLDGGRPAVYVARRDTDSWLATAVGGRLYPGVHHHADLRVDESAEGFHVDLRGQIELEADATRVDRPTGTLFPDVEAATEFFATGSVGLSPTRDGTSVEGVELAATFTLEPLRIDRFRSSWFDARLPTGAAELDCGFLMHDVPSRWSSVPRP